MKKEEQHIPCLRFSEFNNTWKAAKLKELTKINQGLQIPISQRYTSPQPNSYFYITNEFLRKNSKKSYYIANPPHTVICNVEDILMTRTGNTGQVVTGVHGAFHNNFFKVKYAESVYKWFLYYFLKLRKTQDLILRYAGTSTIPDLNHSDFYRLIIHLPALPEQQKIADFLSSVDQKIQALEKKKSLLEQYKKGVMQKIFKQEMRFKQDDGSDYPDWEELPLNKLLKVSRKKNLSLKFDKNDVLSVSGEFGIVNQIEFQGRSFAGASVHNYGIVETGDIVYTKSPLKSNPYGIIKVNKGPCGIVSTLYAVYTVIKERASGNYLDYYFELDDNTNRYLRPLVRKGAKNDMKINNEYVLHDSIITPSLKEQIKIAEFLSQFDFKIKLASKKLSELKVWKKGLLQQMFV